MSGTRCGRRTSSVCPARRGATLIELLVVITILVILAGVAIPVMRPAMQGRRPREAARAVNVYLSSARNRALETRRPCGVMLERMNNQPGASMILQQVESPPPYAGDDLSSRARVQLAVSNGVATVTANLVGGFNVTLVSPGDLIQFNQQGPWYTINNATATVITASLHLRTGQMLPWPTAGPSSPVPYQILRRPKPSAAAPLQLPMGMVVDLGASGIDPAEVNPTAAAPGNSFLGLGPVSIMFSGNGSLERIYALKGDGTPHPLNGPVAVPVYLLVGRNDKVGAPLGEQNWQDMNNFWVAINPQTGMVSTAPVAPYDAATGTWANAPADVAGSRQYARTAQNAGGR